MLDEFVIMSLPDDGLSYLLFVQLRINYTDKLMRYIICTSPKCVKCGCNVADSVEPEVERSAHLRLGHYVDSVWICDDCFRQTMASAADVSPNTPRADEADVT